VAGKLVIEGDSKEVIIVACGPAGDDGVLAAKVGMAVAKARKRRASIHVISPLGRPDYMEVVRPVIQGNIGITMCIRFEGESPEDLQRLVSRLGGEGADPAVFLVGSGCEAYESLLRELGVPYESIGRR